ncbi:hypothetical protein GL213_09205 [Halogeometricum borinquense]|uniref:Uncharacterized protein n=2 Tax=Halogeometricum borinquense TaxID=60847 RepID=A0A6C0UFW6_9EURY|nr:hypothetical protein G3I44_07270 [Halogeometricum borinquense]QIQ76684.1 hypothetical protein GL213_09205 [Halogeometricum borinquense]
MTGMPTTGRYTPDVPIPDGWEQTSSETETMFNAMVVTVRTHTTVLEDTRLRETIRDRTGMDGTWRFFFASRLRFRPKTGMSRTLSRYVTERANDGFVSQLQERGFRDVAATDSRRFAVGKSEADLTQYRAHVVMTTDAERSVDVTAEGCLAVWPTDGGFLLAGGAYPLTVEDGVLDGTVETLLAPETHREELLEMIRSVE